MGEHGIFAAALVIAAAVLLGRGLAARLRVPDAVVLVLLGGAAGFIPGIPQIHVSPYLVLFGILPPLVYHAAFFTAPREARAEAVPIITLAFGLTAVTTAAVAATVHGVLPEVGWAVALAFGAAIAPTDAVAATAVMQRLGAPPRLVTILESESLINDGVALTIFGLALKSLSTPSTPGHVLIRLVQVVVGGVAYGLVVAALARRLRRRFRDPRSQIVLSLAIPYLAYLPAESMGVSGVLAAVTAGFYLGTRPEGLLQPASRLAGQVFWDVLIFLLESALFVLLGLQIHGVLEQVGGHSWRTLALAAVAVTVVAVAVRVVWELAVQPLVRLLPGRHRGLAGLDWRVRLVIGLSGLRGAISLAIALSLPLDIGPERGVLIFLTAVVVIVTLVGQAPILPPLMRAFGLVETDLRHLELTRARKDMIESALARLEELAADEKIDDRTADAFRQPLELRLDRLRAQLDEDYATAEELPDTQRLRKELFGVQRDRLASLYRKGRISADTLRTIGDELTFQEAGTRR
ncbi:MAG: Na+/H+ antiporter [Streptosporangiaceae bacterium]|nr:Na+/H+ antiporter [Streptosporangiaceae bacterium]